MKFCLMILMCLGIAAPVAAQVDPFDPVTPWPVEVGREIFQWRVLEGTWQTVAVDREVWTLQIETWQPQVSYHWRLFPQATPALSTEGWMYLRDRYLVSVYRVPFASPQVMVVFLAAGELHLQIGDIKDFLPRQELVFSKR